jgi:hypothetical protein
MRAWCGARAPRPDSPPPVGYSVCGLYERRGWERVSEPVLLGDDKGGARYGHLKPPIPLDRLIETFDVAQLAPTQDDGIEIRNG